MASIKQSTAYSRTFLMILSSDHVTGASGKTVGVTISKNGAAFVTPVGSVSEIGSGWYSIALTAADTGTLKDLAFHCTATGCDPTDFCEQVVALDPFTATVNPGSGGIAAASFAASAITSSVLAANAIGSSQIAASGAQKVADELLDRTDGVEAGLTLRGALRVALTALAGKVSGAATTAVLVRNTADTKTRISATVDADGNRSAVTLDAT